MKWKPVTLNKPRFTVSNDSSSRFPNTKFFRKGGLISSIIVLITVFDLLMSAQQKRVTFFIYSDFSNTEDAKVFKSCLFFSTIKIGLSITVGFISLLNVVTDCIFLVREFSALKLRFST